MSNAFRQRKGAQEVDNNCVDDDVDDNDDDDADADDADNADNINGVGEKKKYIQSCLRSDADSGQPMVDG